MPSPIQYLNPSFIFSEKMFIALSSEKITKSFQKEIHSKFFWFPSKRGILYLPSLDKFPVLCFFQLSTFSFMSLLGSESAVTYMIIYFTI